MITTLLELLCAALLALFLYTLFPSAALLPFAVLAGLMAWSRR